jgi:23S rRNA (adenine2030-N6)-methyltransferase
MREQDRLWLFELHSREVIRLRENFQAFGKRVMVEEADGFAALKALLPPPPRRALVLIDPPYEERRDYERVVHALKECLPRFPGGTYMLWYPQLTRLEAHDLPPRLKRLPASSWLHVTLRVRTPAADGFGMHGSGLFVVNPPWTLQATLQEVMPYLVEVLGLDAGAGFTLDSQEA